MCLILLNSNRIRVFSLFLASSLVKTTQKSNQINPNVSLAFSENSLSLLLCNLNRWFSHTHRFHVEHQEHSGMSKTNLWDVFVLKQILVWPANLAWPHRPEVVRAPWRGNGSGAGKGEAERGVDNPQVYCVRRVFEWRRRRHCFQVHRVGNLWFGYSSLHIWLFRLSTTWMGGPIEAPRG